MRNILLSLTLITGVFAIDYSTFTNDELFDVRGTIATEDRTAFQDEMKSRMQSLTPEERSALRSTQTNTGITTRQKLKDGTGTGNMYKGLRGGGRR